MLRKLFILVFLTTSLFLFSAPAALAGGVIINSDLYPEGSPTLTGKPTGDAPSMTRGGVLEYTRTYITYRIVNTVLGIAGVIAIYFLITNAWYLVASAGSEEVVTQRKKGLMWAIIGLLLLILSFSIMRFIASIPFQAGEVPQAASDDYDGLSQEQLESINSGPVDSSLTLPTPGGE